MDPTRLVSCCSPRPLAFLLLTSLLVFFCSGVLSPRIPMLGTKPEGEGEAAGKPAQAVTAGKPTQAVTAGKPTRAVTAGKPTQAVREAVESPRMVYPQPKVLSPPRTDVLVLTPWLAPVVWEGTFNIDILNEQFRLQNVTVGLTVFALKKYVVFLKLFLETAEKHFMVGHRVNYYVFTDRPADVPRLPLRAGRRLVVLEVPAARRWQDVSMGRMETLSSQCEQRFAREVGYLVCLDVDMRFRDHVGVEILAPLFGVLHPGFYRAPREAFTYERRPQSRAYIPQGQGDFYYMGSFFGGSVPEVRQLTRACHQAMAADRASGIEAVWHDESHLNRYLLDHKPSKVLSPEYMWDEAMLGWPAVMRKLRFVAVPKNHQEIRNP